MRLSPGWRKLTLTVHLSVSVGWIGAVAAYLATPPNDLAPGAAGALVDEEVHERDIVATLVDLGNRGVLRIKEVESGGFGGLFASKDFEISRTENTTQLRPF